MGFRVRRSIALTWVALFLSATLAWAAPLQSLVNGLPVNENQIGPSAYVELPARRPAHARFVWVNFAGLEDLGIDLPENGFTPDYEREYGDAFHWVVPDTENESDYAPGERKVWSSFYGGSRIGTGYGDGRAATLHGIQIKYVGKTGLSPQNSSDFVHSYGRGPLSRAISEGMWGEVGQDFPWGANRMLFASDRGTYTHWPEANGQPASDEREGLGGREVPTRPAHFMDKENVSSPPLFSQENLDRFNEKNDQRVAQNILLLPDALPKRPGLSSTASSTEKLRAGLNEYVDRLAEQCSFEIANRFFKADTSPSNIELSGKLLDYDAMTVQPHYMYLKSQEGFKVGDLTEAKKELVTNFLASVRKHAPAELRAGLPTNYELQDRFETQYAYRVRRNFVELTGLPRSTLNELEANPAGRLAISKLGEALQTIAFTGAKEFLFKDQLPTEAPTYDLPRILVSLASRDPQDRDALNSVLKTSYPSDPRRKDLINKYQAVMKYALAKAESEGIHAENFQNLVYQNSKIRNADVPEMHRPQLRQENEKLVSEYLRTGNRSLIWSSMLERIQRSRRVFKSPSPYQLVIMENRDPFHGMTTRHIYDAKTGKYEILVDAKIKNGETHFYGNRIPLHEMEHARLMTSANGWTHAIQPEIHADFVRFRLPSKLHPGNTEMALRSGDGHHWWKDGAHNVSISFAQRHSIPAHPASPDPSALPELHFAPPSAAPSVASTETVEPVAPIEHEEIPAPPPAVVNHEEMVSAPPVVHEEAAPTPIRQAPSSARKQSRIRCILNALSKWLRF